MIKANELRIGNETDKGIVKTFWEKGVHVGFGKCYEFSELEPIPLSDEWLLKFKEIEKKADGLFIFKLPFDYEIRIIEGKKGYTFWTQNTLLFLGTDSVHQLQNLYFALTGAELTVA